VSDTEFVLAIDQGTTSTRAILFDREGRRRGYAQAALRQIYPSAGWVEHDPDEIWQSVVETVSAVLGDGLGGTVAAIGITNQRETAIVWDRRSGRAIANAIVWQDRRTAAICEALRRSGIEAHLREATGLLIDPYFSASKLVWLFQQRPELQSRAEAGELCFGTVDSWLLFKLTGGKAHITDASNAARTLLYDIRKGDWDERLLSAFGIPRCMLPDVRDCQAEFGVTAPEIFGAELPITGVAGDQQAAAFGQACFSPGAMKATFGTGCFVLANTGDRKVASEHRMLSTVLHQIAGRRTYALEGAIFMAGATVQWLRDGLGLIASAAESEILARQADPKSDVYLVPAFQGLGAPFWDADARAGIVGLSRASSKADVVRAGLESVAFQTRDLLSAMEADMSAQGIRFPDRIKVDGGMTENGWFLQCLADTLGQPVEVAGTADATALGAAYHAGQRIGFYGPEEELTHQWHASCHYDPRMSRDEREDRYGGWLRAVDRVRSQIA
jgi:glycerol kinase